MDVPHLGRSDLPAGHDSFSDRPFRSEKINKKNLSVLSALAVQKQNK